MHRKVQFCDDPKNIHKIFITPKMFICLSPPPPQIKKKIKKILVIKILNTKNIQAYIYMEMSEYPIERAIHFPLFLASIERKSRV